MPITHATAIGATVIGTTVTTGDALGAEQNNSAPCFAKGRNNVGGLFNSVTIDPHLTEFQ
jgi:hypothetical protein